MGVTSKLSSGALYSKVSVGGAGVLDFVEISSESCVAWLWHAIIDDGRSLPSSLILSRLNLLSLSRVLHLRSPFSSFECRRFSTAWVLSSISVYGISLVHMNDIPVHEECLVPFNLRIPLDLFEIPLRDRFSISLSPLSRLLFDPLSLEEFSLPTWNNVRVDDSEILMFTDGSCCRGREVSVGFAVVSQFQIGVNVQDALADADMSFPDLQRCSGWFGFGGAVGSCGNSAPSISLAELIPVFYAMLLVPFDAPVCIYSDSAYVCKVWSSFLEYTSSQKCKLRHLWLWDRIFLVLFHKLRCGGKVRIEKVRAHLPFDSDIQDCALTLGNYVADIVAKTVRASSVVLSSRLVTGLSRYSFVRNDVSITTSIRSEVREQSFQRWSDVWKSHATMGFLYNEFAEQRICCSAYMGLSTGRYFNLFRSSVECFRAENSLKCFVFKLQTATLPSWTRIMYNENCVGPISRFCSTNGNVDFCCRLCYTLTCHRRGTSDHILRECSALENGRSIVLKRFGLFLDGIHRNFSSLREFRDIKLFFSESCFDGELFCSQKDHRTSILVFGPSGVSVHSSWFPVLGRMSGMVVSLVNAELVIDQLFFNVVSEIVLYIDKVSALLPLELLQWFVNSGLVFAFLCPGIESDLASTLSLPTTYISASSIFCCIQPVSAQYFASLLDRVNLRSKYLFACVSVEDGTIRMLHNFGCEVLVEFAANCIPVISTSSLLSDMDKSLFKWTFATPVVLVGWHASLTIPKISLKSILNWNSFSSCVSSCIFGGLRNVSFEISDVSSNEQFLTICEVLGETAMANFESFFMEREGDNIYLLKSFWMASLPEWFEDYLLELQVPVSCVKDVAIRSALVLAKELRILWLSFVERFQSWKTEECPEALESVAAGRVRRHRDLSPGV